MTTPADQVLSLQRPGSTVSDDLACIQCGYNLRTLLFNTLCPDCAISVLRSKEETARVRATFKPADLRASAIGLVWLYSLFLVLVASVTFVATFAGETAYIVGATIVGVVMGFVTLSFGALFLDSARPYVTHVATASDKLGRLGRGWMQLASFLALILLSVLTCCIATAVVLAPAVAWRSGQVLHRFGRPSVAKCSIPAVACNLAVLPATVSFVISSMGPVSGFAFPERIAIVLLVSGQAMTIALLIAVVRSLSRIQSAPASLDS